MKNYNSAFFNLFENVFLLLKNKYGEEKALEHFAELMQTGLSRSYGENFKTGCFELFSKLVSERDELVGLKVTFRKINDDEFFYMFWDDPFPNLKGQVDAEKLDSCYMNFKVSYLLGPMWSYKTTKHLWWGDEYTEHRIFKKPCVLLSPDGK